MSDVLFLAAESDEKLKAAEQRVVEFESKLAAAQKKNKDVCVQ